MSVTRTRANSSGGTRGAWTPIVSAFVVGLVSALALSALTGCSKDITGHYLSEEGYVRIHEEKGQTLLEQWPNRHYAAGRKPRNVMSLRRDGDQFIGSLAGFAGAGVVSRTDDGIFVVGMGEKEFYREIDFEAGSSELPEEFVLAEVSKQLIGSVAEALEKEDRGACGTRMLGKRQRKTLAAALAGAKLELDDDATRVTKGTIWDRYQTTVKLELPAVKTEFPDESVCMKTTGRFLLKKCVQWETKDFVAETSQTTIPVTVQIDVSRFAAAGKAHDDLNVVAFGGERGGLWAAEQTLCKQMLTDKEHLAFRDEAR